MLSKLVSKTGIWLNMSGDPSQLMPVVSITNGAMEELADLLAHQLLVDPSEDNEHFMLKRLFRHHPHLIQWPNSDFYKNQTCYQSDQSDERLQIDLSGAIVRSNLIDLFAKTRVVKSDVIDLNEIELSEFKLT